MWLKRQPGRSQSFDLRHPESINVNLTWAGVRERSSIFPSRVYVIPLLVARESLLLARPRASLNRLAHVTQSPPTVSVRWDGSACRVCPDRTSVLTRPPRDASCSVRLRQCVDQPAPTNEPAKWNRAAASRIELGNRLKPPQPCSTSYGPRRAPRSRYSRNCSATQSAPTPRACCKASQFIS